MQCFAIQILWQRSEESNVMWSLLLKERMRSKWDFLEGVTLNGCCQGALWVRGWTVGTLHSRCHHCNIYFSMSLSIFPIFFHTSSNVLVQNCILDLILKNVMYMYGDMFPYFSPFLLCTGYWCVSTYFLVAGHKKSSDGNYRLTIICLVLKLAASFGVWSMKLMARLENITLFQTKIFLPKLIFSLLKRRSLYLFSRYFVPFNLSESGTNFMYNLDTTGQFKTFLEKRLYNIKQY